MNKFVASAIAATSVISAGVISVSLLSNPMKALYNQKGLASLVFRGSALIDTTPITNSGFSIQSRINGAYVWESALESFNQQTKVLTLKSPSVQTSVHYV